MPHRLAVFENRFIRTEMGLGIFHTHHPEPVRAIEGVGVKKNPLWIDSESHTFCFVSNSIMVLRLYE